MSTTRERYLEWKTRCALPHIPIEIWTHIFSYLKFPDLISLRLVSRTFYSCINQHTSFWSLVIFNIDQCSNAIVPVQFLRNISTSNLDLLSKTNRYLHCQIYLKGQPLKNSQTKRRKRRLLTLYEDDDEQQKQNYLRCFAVHFESLRPYDQYQLEYLLKKSVRRLEFSYECISNEPSLQFLLKLERLKYLKLSFLHNIFELDPFAIMLINTIQDILILLFKLRRLKTLVLHNLYLIQNFPENKFFIEHLRSIWFENCINLHYLLPIIDRQHLKNIVIRQSTCDQLVFSKFFNQLSHLHHLDLSSLVINVSNPTSDRFNLPTKLKTCSLHQTFLPYCSFQLSVSLHALELFDIDIDSLLSIIKTFSSLKILCLFFSEETSSLSSIIQILRNSHFIIHLHMISIDEKHFELPSNIFIRETFNCFCYENLFK